MMYPTDNHRREPAGHDIESDITYLTRTVGDANHKPYLRTPLTESLIQLGHSREAAEKAVEQYFKVSLQ